MKRALRNRRIRSEGRWDARRLNPPITLAEHPEAVKRLRTVANREILTESERYLHEVERLQGRIHKLEENCKAAKEDHDAADKAQKKAAASLERSETAFVRHRRTDPVYRGWRRYIGPAIVTGIATAVDTPLNYEAFSRGGESDPKTMALTVTVTAAVMLGCHTAGKYLREAKSATESRIAAGLGLVLLAILLSVSLIRRSVIAANVAQYFPDVEPMVFFILYVALQLLIFAIAINLAYRIHCPLQANFDEKCRAERRAVRHEKRMCDRVHNAEAEIRTAINRTLKEKLIYVGRDKKLRLAAEESHAVYIEANKENRSDLDDGVQPVAYSLPLQLIIPAPLQAIYAELGYEPNRIHDERLISQ